MRCSGAGRTKGNLLLSELGEPKQHVLEKMGKDTLGTGVSVSCSLEVLMKTPEMNGITGILRIR